MNTGIIASVAFLISWFLGWPPLTIFHELGHACTALGLGHQEVQVYLGTTPHRVEQQPGKIEPTFIVGKMAFYCYPPGLFRGIGWAMWRLSFSRRQGVLTLLAGPATTLFFLVVLSLITYLLRPDAHASAIQVGEYYLFLWFSVIAFWQFLVTAIPMRYPSWWGAYAGATSDGYKVIALLQDD